jgi:hypothetical protein
MHVLLRGRNACGPSCNTRRAWGRRGWSLGAFGGGRSPAPTVWFPCRVKAASKHRIEERLGSHRHLVECGPNKLVLPTHRFVGLPPGFERFGNGRRQRMCLAERKRLLERVPQALGIERLRVPSSARSGRSFTRVRPRARHRVRVEFFSDVRFDWVQPQRRRCDAGNTVKTRTMSLLNQGLYWYGWMLGTPDHATRVGRAFARRI